MALISAVLGESKDTFCKEFSFFLWRNKGLVISEGGVQSLCEGPGLYMRDLPLLGGLRLQARVDALIGEPDGFGSMLPLKFLHIEAGLLQTASQLCHELYTSTRSSRRQRSSSSSPIPVIFISPQRKKQAKRK